MAKDDCLICTRFNGQDKGCKDTASMVAVGLSGCHLFDKKETTEMNQCETDGCSYMLEGRCTALNYNPKTWTLRGTKGCHAFTKKEAKMLEEKDCRRCEKLNEEGECTDTGGRFKVRIPKTS